MANVNNLFLLLKQLNISAKKISDDTGISTGNISDWKSGRCLPSADKIELLADYFNVSTDYLLGRSALPNQSITTGDVTNNTGVIGHINSPTTINNSSAHLTPQKATLLELYDQLSVIKQAELLAYAAKLKKD